MLSRPISRLLAGLLAVVALSAQAAPPVDPPAYGLIVGYRAEVDALQAVNRDRGPWKANSAHVRDRWQEAVAQGRDRSQRVAKEAGVRVKDVGEAGSAALLRFEAPMRGQALADAMRRLRLHPDVAWVQPNVLERRTQTLPNDPQFSLQWHLQAPVAPLLSALNLPQAWARTTGNAGVVAVVDSGVRFDHPDLAGKLLPGYDFVSELDIANDGNGRDSDASDPGDWVSTADLTNPVFDLCTRSDSSWHGTFIAGQIGALSNNSLGVAGLSWNARVLPVRVSGKCGALVSDLLDGVRWAAGLPVAGAPVNPTPARVINLSFGGSESCTQDPAYQSTVDAVTNAGSLLVVAAGNNGGPLTRPADCHGVMAVASVDKGGAKAWYSGFGANVALAAPGGSDDDGPDGQIWSTDNAGTTVPSTNTYGYKQGTSFSAPQAAGVAALMLSINANLTPADLIYRMKLGARPHTLSALPACSLSNPEACDCTTTTCGAGLLDAAKAVQLADGPAAIIERIGTVAPGSVITLDGRASVALSGSIVSYQWTQLSGPAVTIVNANQAVAGVTLPQVEARYEFQLQVTDNTTPTALTGADIVSVTAAYPPPAPSGGGGGMGWAWGMALWAWVLALGWARRARS